ncbi:MAG: hypothetical protein H6Q17_764 [Bacteroidetes bacterium]|jgi:hypothetical protein|nr:hypothetical protein [Bacteroidota bacterium]
MNQRFTKTLAGICIGLLFLLILLYKEHTHISSQSSAINSANSRIVCSIDTNMAYHVMWQKLFLTRDQIREEYYCNHIALVSSLNPV